MAAWIELHRATSSKCRSRRGRGVRLGFIQQTGRHLLFGMPAYRIQADALGDLDAATIQLLSRTATVESLDEVLPLVTAQDQRNRDVPPGTVLTRE